MATYIYETIPQKKGEKPERFEIQQSMNDKPLKKHPKTGQPVQRVITGGFGYMKPSGDGGGGMFDDHGHDHSHDHDHDH